MKRRWGAPVTIVLGYLAATVVAVAGLWIVADRNFVSQRDPNVLLVAFLLLAVLGLA